MANHIFDDGTELKTFMVHPLQWIAFEDSEEDAIVGKGSTEEEALSDYWGQVFLSNGS